MTTFDSIMEKYFKANPCQHVSIYVFCMREKYLLFLMDIGIDIKIHTITHYNIPPLIDI